MFSSIVIRRASETVEKQIKDAILSRKVKIGERLPSEKALSQVFGTSRTTVREALRVLEKEGFIIVKQGVKGGSYVREADSFPFISSLVHMLELKKASLENITEARLVIEPEIAKLAALRFNGKDKERIEKCLNKMSEILNEGKRSTRTNLEFHRAIGESCKNPALCFINDSLMNLLEQSLSELISNTSNNRALLDQHIKIYKSIVSRKAEEAHSIMRNHIIYVKKIMKKPKILN